MARLRLPQKVDLDVIQEPVPLKPGILVKKSDCFSQKTRKGIH